MAIFPVSLLPGEPSSAPPPPKPRQLKLPPRPPAPRDDASDARATPRPTTSNSQPRRQAQASLANQRTVTRQQAERDARQASAERAQEQAVLPYAGQGGQSGQGGQGGSGGSDPQRGRDDEPGGAASANSPGALELAADELDCHLLAGLMPSGADDGIFEVLLPGGDKLGVAVDVGARSTSLLLMPSSERLRTQIKKKKMELENALERRMETQVRLTVL